MYRNAATMEKKTTSKMSAEGPPKQVDPGCREAGPYMNWNKLMMRVTYK